MVDETTGALRHGVPRLAASARVLLRALGHRLDLAALEAREARVELVFFVALLGMAVAAAFLAGFTLSLLVAAIFWDTPYRVVALVCLAVAQIAAAVAGLGWVRARARAWRPLAETREQLRKDAECLNRFAFHRER